MQTWENFYKYENIFFTPNEIEYVLTEIDNSIVKSSKKIYYYNIPCSFDIETSSFYDNGEKKAIMYIWSFNIDGISIVGRNWKEFIEMLEVIKEKMNLTDDFRLIIYIQNLAYEFQFFRKLFEWDKIFALDTRKPLYALTNGIEFRCSYLLTGYNLAKVGENLKYFKVSKKVGDLDYSKLRHEFTEMKKGEMGYVLSDTRVVVSLIKEKIIDNGGIDKIPLTKTSYVRNYCRKKCYYDGSHKKNTKKYHNYRGLMENLTIEPNEYELLEKAFQGGFTHANSFFVGKIMKDVKSIDFTSSYPYTMVSDYFPMSKGKKVEVKNRSDFDEYIKNYCCLFIVRFENIESTSLNEHYISSSRCYDKLNLLEDNGRVVKGDCLTTVITELDYKIIEKYYTWEKMEISTFYIYKKGYLPKDLIQAILKLYEDKTVLKDVKGKEEEYLSSKEMINAVYGMMVTSVVRDEILYNDDIWENEKPNLEEKLESYNRSKNRFLFYPWGVWVTAHARYNLFTGISAFGTDYIYSDTDAIKVRNFENHLDYVENYNNNVLKKIQRICDYYDLDINQFSPKTIEGKVKTIGIWDNDGDYTRFKTLGAKRYMVEENGKINITVSGLNKKIAVPYLLEKYKEKTFEKFNNDLYIPKGKTGKKTLTYIDDEIYGHIQDYNGVWAEYSEKSCVHMEDSDYTLSLAKQFIDYLKGIRSYEK